MCDADKVSWQTYWRWAIAGGISWPKLCCGRRAEYIKGNREVSFKKLGTLAQAFLVIIPQQPTAGSPLQKSLGVCHAEQSAPEPLFKNDLPFFFRLLQKRAPAVTSYSSRRRYQQNLGLICIPFRSKGVKQNKPLRVQLTYHCTPFTFDWIVTLCAYLMARSSPHDIVCFEHLSLLAATDCWSPPISNMIIL